jgi:hypothetical protein
MTRAASLIGSFLSTLFSAPFQSEQDLSTYRRSRPRSSLDMELRHAGTDGTWENEGGCPVNRGPRSSGPPSLTSAGPSRSRCAQMQGSMAKKLSSQSAESKTRAIESTLTRRSQSPENKPAGITAADEAGNIIHEWQVLRDQARRMIT